MQTFPLCFGLGIVLAVGLSDCMLKINSQSRGAYPPEKFTRGPRDAARVWATFRPDALPKPLESWQGPAQTPRKLSKTTDLGPKSGPRAAKSSLRTNKSSPRASKSGPRAARRLIFDCFPLGLQRFREHHVLCTDGVWRPIFVPQEPPRVT